MMSADGKLLSSINLVYIDTLHSTGGIFCPKSYITPTKYNRNLIDDQLQLIGVTLPSQSSDDKWHQRRVVKVNDLALYNIFV